MEGYSSKNVCIHACRALDSREWFRLPAYLAAEQGTSVQRYSTVFPFSGTAPGCRLVSCHDTTGRTHVDCVTGLRNNFDDDFEGERRCMRENGKKVF